MCRLFRLLLCGSQLPKRLQAERDALQVPQLAREYHALAEQRGRLRILLPLQPQLSQALERLRQRGSGVHLSEQSHRFLNPPLGPVQLPEVSRNAPEIVEGDGKAVHVPEFPIQRQALFPVPLRGLIMAEVVGDLAQVAEAQRDPPLVAELPAESQALLVKRPGPLVLTLVAQDRSKIGQRAGGAFLVTQPLEQGQALLHQHCRLLVLALRPRQHAGATERSGLHGWG